MPKTAPSCPCVPSHSPVPLAFQMHHVVPKSWNGASIPSNMSQICGTCHDNIHHALDEVVRVAYGSGGTGALTPAQLDQIVKPYTPYAQELIRRAVAEVGPVIPHVYTLSHPGEEHTHEHR